MQIHPTAEAGFTAGAGAYSRGRPDYPEALLNWLTDSLGVSRDTQVLDLAAGTGKFTNLLVRTGADVVAVEPVEAMRNEFGRAVSGVEVVEGTAEAIPLPTSSFDLVTCAQAFHWFANATALGEIHRVLRTNGILVLVWNERNEDVSWVHQITELIAPYEGELQRFRHREPWIALDSELFSLVQEISFDHVHRGPAQEVVIDRTMSISYVASLAHGERTELEQHLLELVRHHPELKARDLVEMPYRTRVYALEKVGG